MFTSLVMFFLGCPIDQLEAATNRRRRSSGAYLVRSSISRNGFCSAQPALSLPPVVNVRVAQGEGGRQREKQTFTNVPKSSEVSIESDHVDIMGTESVGISSVASFDSRLGFLNHLVFTVNVNGNSA